MADMQKQLLAVVTELRFDLISSFALSNRVATGSTESKIEATATESSAQLTAPWWIYTLQDGRKPTSLTGPYQSGPTLLSQIKIWCKAKGIESNLAYAITKHIHKYGYPGTPGLIDKPLSDENIDKVMNKQLGLIANLFYNDIVESIKIPESTPEPVTA